MELKAGLQAEIVTVVSHDDTAERIGSGDVPVLGTPRLLALAEQATVAAVRENLPPGHTSVGTVIRLEHLAASPVGMPVTVTAELTRVDGRRLVFGVTASDARRDRDRLGHDRAGRRRPRNVPLPPAPIDGHAAAEAGGPAADRGVPARSWDPTAPNPFRSATPGPAWN